MTTWSQPAQVGVQRGRGVGHRPERVDVGHGVARRRVDGRGRSVDQVCRAASRASRSARWARARRTSAAGVPAPGAADDQVALEGGRLDLQRPEQAADVAAAARLVGRILEPAGEVGLLRAASCCAGPAGSRSTWSRIRSIWARRSRIRSVDLGAGRVEPEPYPQLRGQRVGQPAGLGQRDRAARTRSPASEPAPDQCSASCEPFGRPGPTRTAQVADQQLVAVRHRLPQGHATAGCRRSRPAACGEPSAAWSSWSSSRRRPSRHCAERVEVGQRRLRLDRRAQPAGRGRGDRCPSAVTRHGVPAVDGLGRCRCRAERSRPASGCRSSSTRRRCASAPAGR